MFLKNIPQTYEWGGAGIPEYTFIIPNGFEKYKSNFSITISIEVLHEAVCFYRRSFFFLIVENMV